MSNKIGGVVALVAMCALSLFLLNCGSSSSRPSGILYVLTQGTNQQGPTGIGENVSSFAINFKNGTLSLINSNASACPTAASITDPEPCGLPLDILLDPAGAAAFVLDEGIPCPEEFNSQDGMWECQSAPVPPAIYPYTVNSDGSLSSPGTAVTWTCAGANVATPCSDAAVAMMMDASGQFLFVIDQGSFPSPGTESPLVYPSCPHVPSGPTDVCPSISVFNMHSGSLTLASGSPFYLSKIPTALSPITFTPPNGAAQELLFVSNNHDICTTCTPQHNDNTVSEYSVNSGVLTEVANSPYAVTAQSPSSVFAVYTNRAQENTGGLFVYVGQGVGSGALYPFQVCTVENAGCTAQQVAENLMTPLLESCAQPPCTPVPPTSVGQDPVAMLADPTSNFLYVLSEGSNQVFGFTINPTAGTLAVQAPPNQSTGSYPVAMAMHASVNSAGQPLYNANWSGQYLYTANTVSDNITGFTVSTTNGSMSSPITVITPAAPSGMATN